MNWSIEFSPLVPILALWAAAGIAVLLFILLIIRRNRGAFLRLASLAALMLALANPTLKQEERESLNNIALVVTDESASQLIGGRPAQTAAIRADLEAKLAKIPGLQVQWVSSSKPGGESNSGTTLFADVNKALANIPPDRLAGVIMITDGQVHDVPKSAAALGFDAPVHALITGAKGEFDRRIEVIKAPRYGIVGQAREIEFAVRESGSRSASASGEGDVVNIKIRREGEGDESRRVRIGQKVVVPYRFPHAGQNFVEIEVDQVPGELTGANNRVVVAAEGVRDHLRVLLVSGEPHAGERTWRNLLKSDAAVDLVHFTILRPPEKQDGTPTHQLSLIAFPVRELFAEKIDQFDLIIFDRYQRRNILPFIYLDNIASYVESKGGALLVAAGEDYASNDSLFRTPLSKVLPASPSGRVITDPYKPRVTEEGERHPVTRGLSGDAPASDPKAEPKWGRWFRTIDARASQGRVLMNGAEQKPLLVLDRKGKGRVALMLSDHAWLWARGYEGGGPHTDLLRRLSHWLMKEPDMEEEHLAASAKGLKLTIERRSMEQEVPPVGVTAPGGEKTEVTLEKSTPGVWRSTIDVKLPGLYKLQSGTLTALTHAGIDDAREMSVPNSPV